MFTDGTWVKTRKNKVDPGTLNWSNLAFALGIAAALICTADHLRGSWLGHIYS